MVWFWHFEGLDPHLDIVVILNQHLVLLLTPNNTIVGIKY